jgi:hypothetical protein
MTLEAVFAGKGARGEAARALTRAAPSWRDDPALEPRGEIPGIHNTQPRQAVMVADRDQLAAIPLEDAAGWRACRWTW